MNGHSTAETLAYALLDARRRLQGNREGSDESPLFVLTAGWHAGDQQLRQRLASVIQIADAEAIAPSLLDGLARQFMHFASKAIASRPPSRDSVAEGEGDANVRLRQIAGAQATFLRALGVRSNEAPQRWGLAMIGVTGEYALYLRLLFPKARIIFLHRDPIETFLLATNPTRSEPHSPVGDLRWAGSFAESWCKVVASFQLWWRDAGALVVSFDRVVAERAAEIEDYLGESIAPIAAPLDPEGGISDLRAAELKFVRERTAHLASQLGYPREHSKILDRLGKLSASPDSVRDGSPVPAGGPRCAVLVPTMRYIEPDCDDALRELERRGYVVRRLHGCSAIDAARNRLATWALDEGFAETLWVDADVAFDPDAVDALRAHDLPIICGIYAKKGAPALAVATVPGATDMLLGKDGGVTEILYAATGFLLVKRQVYEAIQRRFELPICSPAAPHRSIPFFMPMLEHWGGEMSYLAEDYAFSRRARLCGYKIMADTSIRLWHIGPYRYGYEDAGNAIERVPTYRHVFESKDRRNA